MASLLNMSGAGLLKKGLPYDAQIEYLEGTGIEYINTGIVPLITDYVYCEYYLVSPLSNNDGSATLFGTFNTWPTNAFAIIASPAKTSNNIYYLRGNTEASNTANISSFCGSWQSFTINSNNASFMGKTLTNNGSGDCLYTAYLFAADYGNGSMTNYGRGSTKRIRKFQWKRNDVLIADYIPVRVGTTGYMYDRVSGQFFGNSGTGNFTLGHDIVPIEYLESTGTQYIKTGINTTINDRIIGEFQLQNYPSSGTAIIGTGGANNGVLYSIRLQNNTNVKCYTTSGNITSTVSSDFNKHIFDLNLKDKTFTIDNNESTIPNTMSGSAYEIFLFGYSKLGVVDNTFNFIGRIYAFKIYANEVLVRDFIPVRIANIGYMYDKVSSQLFGNNGTGSFVLGPDKT